MTIHASMSANLVNVRGSQLLAGDTREQYRKKTGADHAGLHGSVHGAAGCEGHGAEALKKGEQPKSKTVINRAD
jgi:hypothetical protein